MFSQNWNTKYEGHQIEVKNSWIGPTELYVDEKLQDKTIALFSAKLIGKIKIKDIEKELKAIVTATLFSAECNIFIENEVIYTSKK